MKKFFTILMALMLIISTPIFAATPETVNTDATITIGKELTPDEGGLFPDVSEFKFLLEPVSYTLAEDGVTVTDETATYMPAGAEIIVPVTENADGSLMTGSISKTLSFDDKKIGVYTYKLTEVNEGVNGVTYDGSVYYVNVYVINQVNENNVPTGEVTVSNMTAWKTNNMSDEALKALVSDWTGNLNSFDDKSGKVDKGDNELEYPFENEYSTMANLSVKKLITGNYADIEKTFPFTVELAGLVGGTTYDVTLPDGTADTITAEDDGTAKVEVTLGHEDVLVIAGLPSSTTYKVVETQAQTYKGSYAVVDGNTNASGEVATNSNVTVEGSLTDNAVEDNILVDEVITVTNNKEYVAPTGIALSVLPFACGLVVVAALYIVTSKKRQED